LGTTTLFSPQKSENDSMFLSEMRRSFTVAQKLKILNECENNSYKEVSIRIKEILSGKTLLFINSATFFWKIKVFLSKNDRESLARYHISRPNHANLIVYVDGAQSAQKSATSMKRVVAQERMLLKLEKFVTKVERKTKLSNWVYKTTTKLKTSFYCISSDDLIFIRKVLIDNGT
jgi:hypothetical protein